jgi:small conductance mechanosensitive channel
VIEQIGSLYERLADMRVIAIFLVLVFTFALSRTAKRLMAKASTKVKVEPTQYKFMSHFISAVIYLIGFGIIIYMIPSLRALSVSLLAGAGILAIVIGFASQQAFSNLISGVFIIASRPYRVGDIIKLQDGVLGAVDDITLRHTVIKNFQNKRVIIPNSIMNSVTIENYNIEDPKICKWIDFGISYDSDINLAMKIMREEVERHPNFLDIRTGEQKKSKEPAVNVRVVGFGDSSVNIRAWAWAANPGAGFKMACDLMKTIKERFDKEGVEIPFPYRTIVYKKDLKKNRKIRKMPKKKKR